MAEVKNKTVRKSAVKEKAKQASRRKSSSSRAADSKNSGLKVSDSTNKGTKNLERKNPAQKGSVKSSKNLSKKGTGLRLHKNMKLEKNYFIGIAAVVVLVIIVVFAIRGCGVSHKSPKVVVQELTEAYAEGKSKRALECFGDAKDASDALKAEVDATIKYFEAHGAETVSIESCDILSENDKFTYIYIIYKFVMEDEQAYPCISTYMVTKEEGKYYVVPPSEVTVEMSEQAVADFEKFMTTDIYKNYNQDYETFTKKNPGYEKKIAGKVS